MPRDPAPRLIVNADDLGAASGRDAAILELARSGVVTSATLLVNGATATAAVARIRGTPDLAASGLRIGLHLNLSEGQAVAGRSSLTDAAGALPGKFRLRERLEAPDGALNAIADADLQREIRAQVERFVALTGTLPTHVDGHHHVQVVPRIARLLAPILVRDFGIARIRLPGPESAADLEAAWPGDPATRAFQLEVERDATTARTIYANAGLHSPFRMLGRTLMGHRLNATQLTRALDRCRAEYPGDSPAGGHDGDSAPPLFVELMCHPGYPGDDDTPFGRSPERRAEFDFLASPAFTAATAGWTLANWEALTSRPTATHPPETR